MGREAVAVCYWQGVVAEVRLHLDSQALTLRGDIKAAIPRSDIKAVAVVDEGVQVTTSQGVLLIEGGSSEAQRWQKALLKKPPTLAEKLGVSADTPAYVQGVFEDAALSAALEGAQAAQADDAVMLLALVFEEADLQAASDLAKAHPAKHVWMVYRRGKAALVGDTAIRAYMRGLGFVDSKTSAVSDQLTATRYRLRAR